MRCRPAARRGESGQLRRIEIEQIRRQKFIGDEDGARRQLRLAARRSYQRRNQPAFEIAKVGSPFAQARVAAGLQNLGVAAHLLAPGEACALALRDQFERAVFEFGIVDQREMSLDDLPLGAAARGCGFFELRLDRCQSPAECGGFLAHSRACLRDRKISCAQMQDLSQSHSRRRANAAHDAVRAGRFRGGRPSWADGRRRLVWLGLDQLSQNPDRLARIRACRRQHDLVVVLHAERHQCDRALGISAASIPRQHYVGGERLRPLGEQRRRPGVKTVRRADDDFARGREAIAAANRLLGRSGHELQEEFAGFDLALLDALDDGEPVAVRHHDRGDQALRMRGQEFKVELEERRARLDAFAFAKLTAEALPSQRHGIQSDVNDDLRAAIGSDRHGVFGGRHENAVARCVERRAGRIDGYAVAHHPAREHWIGHFVQRRNPALHRCIDRDVGHDPSLRPGSSCTRSIAQTGSTPRRVKKKHRS